MKTSSQLLVVEDDPFLGGMLTEVLNAAGHQVRLASTAQDAMAAFAEVPCDIALLDIDLGSGPTGIDLAINLRSKNPSIGLIFLTQVPEPRFVGYNSKVIPKNASYLLKSQITDPKILLEALEWTAQGQYARQLNQPKVVNPRLAQLSNTQFAVLKLVAQGLSNAEIAEERGTSERAVRAVVSKVMEILGIEDVSGDRRVKAALLYMRNATGSNR